jgi:hypothetical protein
MTPSFEHLKHKETCVPDLSGQKWEVYKMPHLNKQGFIALT